jgi:hypothetical protein
MIRQKLFAANSVLKADDVNNYLRDVTTVDTYAELASLDAGINLAWVGGAGLLFGKVSGQWRKQAGYDSTVWQNGNIGASGLVGVGSTANIIADTFTSPYPTDDGFIHASIAIGAGAGSSIGSVTVNVGTAGFTQVFNVGTSAVPVVINMPFTCGAGTVAWQVNLSVGGGQAAGMAYSSARITV